jgi:carboxymethylenebutenolidase
MSKTIRLTAADGHTLDAYVAEPKGKPRAAVIVVQEIFGVNSHIRSVADGYAAEGYLAIAPAMFDRAERNFDSGYTPDDIQRGRDTMQKIGWDKAMADVTAALDEAKPAGKVGIVGYCWGGTVVWLAAARVPGLAAAVSYYGGGVPNFIDEQPRCPVMFHFGEKDASIPLERAKAVAAAHPGAISHFYPAGHGFNCDQRGSYDAIAARVARERTLEFFAKHLA